MIPIKSADRTKKEMQDLEAQDLEAQDLEAQDLEAQDSEAMAAKLLETARKLPCGAGPPRHS
jgi:hypothetical protein